MVLSTVVILLSLALGTQSLLYDDECTITPDFGSMTGNEPQLPATAEVPSVCTNGTFVWNYPRGQVVLSFPNPGQVPTSVCVREWLGGNAFTITDVTTTPAVLTLARDTDSCTAKTTASEIVIRVDGPERITLYVGGIQYSVRH